MTITGVRDELAARLETIASGGLRVYRQPPDPLPELPAAIIQPGEPLAEYDRVIGAADVSYRFSVLLLSKSADDAQAWEEVAAYVNPTGAGSVKAAVEGTTVRGAGAVNAAASQVLFRVLKATNAGRVSYNKAAYWGVTFHIQAYVSG